MRYPAVSKIMGAGWDENVHIFQQDCELEIIEDIAIGLSHKEKFKKGERIDFDVVKEDPTTFIEIQFPDGDVAFDIPKDLLKREYLN